MPSFDEIKDSVICKLVNTENNQDILKNRPNEQMEDISATFAMLVGEREGERLTLPITNEIMIDMGVDIETLKETAQNNMANQDYSFKSMREVLLDSMFPDGVPENDPMVDMLLPPEDPNMAMYVLSNNGNIYGAAEIMNQGNG